MWLADQRTSSFIKQEFTEYEGCSKFWEHRHNSFLQTHRALLSCRSECLLEQGTDFLSEGTNLQATTERSSGNLAQFILLIPMILCCLPEVSLLNNITVFLKSTSFEAKHCVKRAKMMRNELNVVVRTCSSGIGRHGESCPISKNQR